MTKKYLILLFAAFLVLCVVPAQIVPIAPKAAKEMLAANKGIVLLDVRTLEEFLESRIAGSVLLPYDQITPESVARIVGPKDTTIIVYCRSGRRSEIAAKALLALGYKKIFDFGGISAWPYETIKGEPKKL
jgi:rhodanese-related sulfurtransferase